MNLRRAIPIVLPVTLAILTGLPAVSGGLIRDDALYVVLNPHVTEPTPLSLMLSTPFQPEHELGLYRPVTTASLRLDFVITRWLGLPANPDSAPVWHLTNLLLAGAAAAMVYLLARPIGFSTTAAGMAACVFAVHPARTEAVLWISGRAECLMTLFALASLALGARGARGWRGPLAGLLALLACWSKEQAYVLLFLAPLIPSLTRQERLRVSCWIGGFVILAFAWRTNVVGMGPEGAQQVLHGWGFPGRVVLGISFLGDYIRLCLLPYPLLNEYDEPDTMTAWFPLLVGLLFLAAFAWRCRRDLRDVFLMALFAFPLVPVSNVFYRSGETFAERFLALPAAGAVLLVVRLLARRPRLGGSVLFTATVVLALLSLKRGADYANDRSLMEALVRDAPHQSSSWFLLSTITGNDRKQVAEQERQLQQDMETTEALRKLEPSGPEERALLEELLNRDHQGDRVRLRGELNKLAQEMLQQLRKAIEIDPANYKARMELVRLLKSQGGPVDGGGSRNRGALDEAEAHAREAIRRRPGVFEAHNLLAQVLLAQAQGLKGASRKDRIQEAERELRETLRLEPRSSSAGQDLSRILLFNRREAEAMEFLQHQLEVFRELSEERWWDVRGPQLEAAVLRSIAQLRGEEQRGLEQALPRLDEALDRARSAPLRTELLTGHVATNLERLGRHRDRAVRLKDEVERLEGRVDSARNQSDVMSALATLELHRQRMESAARWYEQAAKSSQRPENSRNMYRAAARILEHRAAALPPGAERVKVLREALRLRRRSQAT